MSVQTPLQRAVAALNAIELCSDCGLPVASGRCDASVTTRFAVHYPSKSPRHDRWFVLSSFEIEKVLLGVAVPINSYGERLGVEMPAWWSPEKTFAFVVTDAKKGEDRDPASWLPERYPSLSRALDAIAHRFFRGYQKIGVNIETGAEIPFPL